MPEAQILKSKEYETIYILRPDVDADAADKVQGRVAEVVARDNGKLVKVESWDAVVSRTRSRSTRRASTCS